MPTNAFLFVLTSFFCFEYFFLCQYLGLVLFVCLFVCLFVSRSRVSLIIVLDNKHSRIFHCFLLFGPRMISKKRLMKWFPRNRNGKETFLLHKKIIINDGLLSSRYYVGNYFTLFQLCGSCKTYHTFLHLIITSLPWEEELRSMWILDSWTFW